MTGVARTSAGALITTCTGVMAGTIVAGATTELIGVLTVIADCAIATIGSTIAIAAGRAGLGITPDGAASPTDAGAAIAGVLRQHELLELQPVLRSSGAQALALRARKPVPLQALFFRM